MLKLYKYFILLFIILNCNSQFIYGQPVPLDSVPISGNKSITQCILNLYDFGGAANNYSNNSNGSITLNPQNIGDAVSITFNTFELENNVDFVYVYNGNSTAAPLIGSYTGNSLPPTIIANNATGTLTIRLFSDAQNTMAGFSATVTCVKPCSVDSAFISGVPAIQPYGTGKAIKVCINQPFNFSGHAYFNQFGDTTNTTYKWDMGDGTNPIPGQTVSYSYPTSGIYQVVLTVNDTAADCYKQELVKVLVSQLPNFAGTIPIPDTICQFDSVIIQGNVDFPMIKEICAPPIADTTFLPDGSGVSYITSITADCFDPTEVITAASDVSVYINMEHSYLGDLEIKLICPNNQSAVLKQYPGGNGTFLGGPNDPGVGDLVPGIGWTYEFIQSAVWGTMLEQNAVAGFLVPSPNPATPGNSLPAGQYKPFQNFSSLIGCPLNGSWSIQVTDNLGSDNGFIFFWGLNFNPNFESNLDSFKNYVVSESWVSDPTFLSNNGSSAKAKLDTIGLKCFTYTVTNDFGCNYDTTICVFVKEVPVTVLYDSICPGQDLYGYTETGVYYDTFTAINSCDSVRILNLYKRPVVDFLSLGADQIYCQYDTILLEPTVLPNSQDNTYEWRINSNLNSVNSLSTYYFMANQSQTIIVGAKPPKGCWKYDTMDIIVNPGDFLINPILDTSICPNDLIQFNVTGANSYLWTPSTYLSDPSIGSPVCNAQTSIQYQLVGTSLKGCTDTQFVNVTVHPDAIMEFPRNINLYLGETYHLQPFTNALYFTWFPNSGINNVNSSNPILNPTVDTRYFFTAKTEYGCEISDSLDVWVKETVMDMPNAFNPNSETFKVQIRGIATLESFKIYNRWGEQVFQTSNISEGWDGKLKNIAQPLGVYVYEIVATTTEGKPFKKTGNVTLVR